MLQRVLFGLIALCLMAVLPPAEAWATESPSDDLVQMIVKLIGDPDKEFRAAGLDKLRTSAKGAAATQQFTSILPKLDSQGQVALLSALADRGDASARSAILQLISTSKDDSVRAAGIAAIGSLGSASDLPLLVKTLSASSNVEQAAAKQSLIKLAGETVCGALATESKSASPAVRATLLDVLATRRASDEAPTFAAAAIDDNAQVRTAAMNGFGQIGRPEQLTSMLAGVLKAAKGGERDNAERNVVSVCSRIDNQDQRATKLIDALNTVPVSDRDELLSLVGRVGGKKLIDFVADIAFGNDAARRKLGIDALSKWPDASVADKLLEIVNKASDPAERNQAFQGYVKIGATRDNRNDKQRLDRMKDAMKAAKTPEEQTLVINRTRTSYDVEAVRFVLPYLDQPQFAQAACETIVEIAHHREVRDPNKAEFDKILDKVIEVTKDPVVVDRAQRYKRGETWERPKK
jgi:HEAT repeat protein